MLRGESGSAAGVGFEAGFENEIAGLSEDDLIAEDRSDPTLEDEERLQSCTPTMQREATATLDAVLRV